MSTGNGTGVPGAAAAAPPVALLRYRPGVTEQTARLVHLVPLPVVAGQAGAAGIALCGASASRRTGYGVVLRDDGQRRQVVTVAGGL